MSKDGSTLRYIARLAAGMPRDIKIGPKLSAHAVEQWSANVFSAHSGSEIFNDLRHKDALDRLRDASCPVVLK